MAPTSAAGPSPPTIATGTVVVHVAGAVVAPGVYELGAGARAADAVTVAGGASPEADVDALNLAAPLQDGERVYVPVVGEAVPPPVAAPTSSAAVGPVDLNRATVDELDGLPGIGPATAQAIVAHREANGPFAVDRRPRTGARDRAGQAGGDPPAGDACERPQRAAGYPTSVSPTV